MRDEIKQNGKAELAHWTYSREEWKQFVRWTKRKKGIFYYLAHILSPGRVQKVPEISITSGAVCIDNIDQPFRTKEHWLKKVDIRSEGKMNILEITYEHKGGRANGPEEIRVLIPKGKLREAIGVQDSLQSNKPSFF